MVQISNKFSIYIAGGRILSMLAGFIMPVVLVRVMPQGDYGLTSQFLTLYTSIYTIAAMGIHTNLFFFCSSVDKKNSDKYVSNTLFLLLLFGIITGLLLSVPIFKNLIFGDSELGNHSDLIILSISLATVMNVVSPLNTIRQDKWGALLYPGFVAFGRIGTILFTVLMFSDIHQMFLGLFVFQCIITGTILVYTKMKTHFRLDFSLMKEQLAYSLPFGLAVALQLISNYFDKLVCIHMLTPTEYAIYSIAFLSIPGITQIYDSLCQVNIVNMSNSYKSGRNEEILPQYGNFVIKTLSFSVPLILVVSLYAEEIMGFLYTSSYASAAPYFRLYSLTFLTSMLGAGTILRSMGKTKQSLYAFIISCIIGLPLTYLLVKKYGTGGAICGAMINMILPRLIQMGLEVKAVNCRINDYIPWRTVATICISSLLLLVPLVIIKFYYHMNIVWCIIESSIYLLVAYGYLMKNNIFVISKKMIKQLLLKYK